MYGGVVIAGGGTGGHIFMGVAIARELLKRDASCRICFVGTSRDLESRILAQEGFHHERIDVTGLSRMTPMRLIASLLLLPKSFFQSLGLLRRWRPRLVIGLGGYSSGPVVLMAALKGIPTLIIEPNAFPGIANRWLSFFVDQVAVAFAEAKSYFRGKAVVTGIPIRARFLALERKQRSPILSLLIYGGSQGSHVINKAVCEALSVLKEYKHKLSIVHQTGEVDLTSVAHAYEQAGIRAEVKSFISDMPTEFERTDLVICRSGASSIAELTAAGKAAILVPFSASSNDHQRKNAEALVSRGAAKMINERELSGDFLARQILEFIERPDKLTEIERASQSLGKKDATKRIVALIDKLVGQSVQGPGSGVQDRGAI